MSFRRTQTALALLALGVTGAGAQYSTPVGSGAAKPKTLRATAVLEWTGSLEKPNASRLMPVAVWDGEHYQPAGLYLARPAPLAFATGTQYELERSGEPAGLFNVRAAAQLQGEWIGIGKYQAEAPPPPPPKLKPSKHLPALSSGKADGSDKPAKASSTGAADSDRPTLHRKADDSQTSGSAPSSGSANGTGAAGSSKDTGTAQQPAATTPATQQPADPADSDHPTLHRRTDSSDSSTTSTSAPAPAGTTTTPGAASSTTQSSTPASSDDADRPTLHRRTDAAGDTTPASGSDSKTDTDRATLHRHDDTAKSADADSDRPTLHRARTGGDQAAGIDPDRPHLRYGGSDDSGVSALPVRLVGVPPSMQQIVAVSDTATGEQRAYPYHWPNPDDAARMQTALASIAAQLVTRPAAGAAKPVAQFGPVSRAAARRARTAQSGVPPVALVDERLTTYELSFSGGPTVVYSAHTADEGARRVYVTLIAQPDFSSKPQILLQQVAHGDRLDETPSMQLVDAADTDGDQRAELIFQLNGAAQAAPAASEPSAAASELAASTATDSATQFARDAAASARASAAASASAAAAIPEREFAIYRVANGKAVQVFNTGPLP